jgi:hypothetical protein
MDMEITHESISHLWRQMGQSKYSADLDSFLDVIGLSPKDPLDSFVGESFE